jgi:hypothetical protein
MASIEDYSAAIMAANKAIDDAKAAVELAKHTGEETITTLQGASAYGRADIVNNANRKLDDVLGALAGAGHDTEEANAIAMSAQE